MKRLAAILMSCLLSGCVLLAFSGCSGSSSSEESTSESSASAEASSSTQDMAENPDKGTRGGRDDNEMANQQENGGNQGASQRGGVDKSDDEELSALIAETEAKFQQVDYYDEATGLSFDYNLFVPEDYDASQTYPLVLFIHDASVVGGATTTTLEQGYGALVWASEEDQAKHPCFVVAPAYQENILADTNGATSYVDATLHLLDSLQENYSVDANRLYITGQSMGCMAALYMNSIYSDLFAASLYVDGQWDVDILSPLEDQSFFYFASLGDDKASTGMAEVKAMFDADGVAYGDATLNAKDSAQEITEGIESVIDEGHRANFISWEAGSVLPDNAEESSLGSEHMYSFDHAYKISAVRDWLFDQSK